MKLKNIVILTFFCVQLPMHYAHSQSVDTTAEKLDEVVIESYAGKTTMDKATGSVNLIDMQDIDYVDQNSPFRIFSTVPGVVLEERSNGSYRLSMRGSTLRSPYGVRNVKIYWNELPLTEPFGTTLLNVIDPYTMSSVQVLKGPAASAFGAGLGGAMFIETGPRIDDQNIKGEINLEAGSYGRSRMAAKAEYRFGQTQHLTTLNYQGVGGYREHTAMDRINGLHISRFYLPETDFEVKVFFGNLNYQLPGGLTAEQREADPTQARPGSQETNASISTNFSDISVKATNYSFDPFTVKFSTYRRYYLNDNPFNLDYKKRIYGESGTRSSIDYEGDIFGLPFQNKLGIEFQWGTLFEQNFGNADGNIDGLNFSDEVNGIQAMVFNNSEWDLYSFLKLSFGLSYNFYYYQIDRLVSNVGTSGRVDKSYPGILAPRLGLLTELDDISFFMTVSRGFSPPTVSEIRTNEGNINQSLDPEVGTNYELGSRWEKGIYSGNASLFHFRINNGITSFAENDRENFRNAGQILNYGLEWMHSLRLWETGTISLDLQQSNWYYNFSFGNYRTADGNFSNNALTGVSPWYNFTGFSATIINRLQVGGGYTYYSPAPLNDANTIYSNPVHDVTLRMQGDVLKGKAGVFQLYGGVNNLLNRAYSFGNDLNAPGQRYFQPAPDRNFYLGLRYRFEI